MATVVHHHHEEGISIPGAIFWAVGIAVMVMALLLISASMVNRPEVTLPALTELPLVPPPLPFMPLM